MAKRITKPKEKAVEPSWYTVAWSYAEKQRGGAVGGSLEVRTRNKAEAQAIVEGKLRAKGITWKEITIVKGRDPGLTWKGGTERYYAELQAMLGIGRLALHAWSDVEPRPMWASPDIMPDPDATARTGWAKFMDESSHGLSVSDFPRFVICDVNGYPTLPLPSEAVKDETRWDGITAVVREQLDYWKATLQERIERLGKIKRRSAEDTDQLKRDKATLKELEAFDGWNYQRYVEQLLPGRTPHALDLDNRRLYRLSNGQLIPVSDLGTYVLRVDFWRRLLALWDGPMDKRADNVRTFLDHHHRNGWKPDVFLELVRDTATRCHKLSGREALAETLTEWHSSASLRRMGRVLSDAIRKDMDLPPLPDEVPPPTSLWEGRSVADAIGEMKHEAHHCLLTLHIESAATVEAYRKKRGRTLKGYRPDLETYMAMLGNQRRELAASWYHAGGSIMYGLTLRASDALGPTPDRLTKRWERWSDGYTAQVIALVQGAGNGAEALREVARLATSIAQLSIGTAEAATYDAQLIAAKDDVSNRGQNAAPGDIAAMFRDHLDQFASGKDRLVERLREIAASAALPTEVAAPTFAALLGATNAEAVRVAMNAAGIVYKPAKGKGRIVAALHAACDHFSKPTPRPMDWPSMLAEFIPGSTWTPKSIPEARPSYQGPQYKEAYRAVKDRLSQ